MADNSKLELASGSSGLGEKMRTQKISVSDHTNGTENSDSFVIDMETFSHGSNKDTNQNSRITLQRNLSRKGSQRGGDKKMNPNSSSPNDRDSIVASTSSPRAAASAVVGAGNSVPDSPLAAAAATATDHFSSSQVHHQITINTSNMGTACAAEGKAVLRRNSFRRSSPWGLDPKRILILFASLSSMGTMLLIYFTLSISKADDQNGLDWQQ